MVLEGELIQRTKEYVKDFFKNDFSGHDYYHTMRVYNLAKSIAKIEGGNIEIIELSALLHDVDDYKLVEKNKEPFHNTKTFLRKNNVDENHIADICNVISTISYKGTDTVTPNTLEGKIVQDADRLDAIGAIGIGRTFAYGGSRGVSMHIPGLEYKENMNAEEYYKNKGTTISHFYEKLLKLKNLMNTDTAKKIAENRHTYMEVFLEEFFKEWDGTR